jgi:hypothetical protein
MELDPVDERVVINRPGVRSATAERLAVGLAGSPDVLIGDRREREKFDRVDLDLTQPDAVTAALLDLRPLPQSDRERDLSGQDFVAQLAAELHAQDASWCFERRRSGALRAPLKVRANQDRPAADIVATPAAQRSKASR